MMKIEVFDVEHGQCSMITCPNGKRILVDAGHNSTTGWRPSLHFFGQTIDNLIISNYDEDHVSDFVNLYNLVSTFSMNRTVTAAALRSMKREGMGDGIRLIHDLLLDMERGASQYTPIDFAGLSLVHYCNFYPTFVDENNLSLVTFITYAGFTMLFPGDLEKVGWKSLLRDPSFCNNLSKVNVLLASHHGRESGCCEEVFQYCQPEAVIISDAGIQYATQGTVNWYSQKARGYRLSDGSRRYVHTTRSDGKITIEVNWDGSASLNTSSQARAYAY